MNVVATWAEGVRITKGTLFASPGPPRGVFEISSDWDDQMEPKVKSQKNSLGLPAKAKKIILKQTEPKQSCGQWWHKQNCFSFCNSIP